MNPLRGENSFNTMTAEERLILLKALSLWALHSSDAVNSAIKLAYKQTRRDDDRNQPKAVQPWFSDSWRRKYYLIEGQEDTYFRIYRENDGKTSKTNTWFSVAGSIDEAKVLADKFEQEMPGTHGKLLGEKIRGAIPRWEAGEEKRRRKDYRLARKAAFARPEPGFSLYEGRTRGKRMRYTFDENEDLDDDSDAYSARRSARNVSGTTTPFEEARPVVTASGRQVKSRLHGAYGESVLTDQRKEMERDIVGDGEDEEDERLSISGRPMRSTAAPVQASHVIRGRYADGLESESESDEREPSGEEWSGNEDEADEESEADLDDNDAESEDELMDARGQEDEEDDNTQESLVVQLRYKKNPQPNGFGNGPEINERNPLVEVENRDMANGMTKTEEMVKSIPLPTTATFSPPQGDRPFGHGHPVGENVAAIVNGAAEPPNLVHAHPSHPSQVETMDVS